MALEGTETKPQRLAGGGLGAARGAGARKRRSVASFLRRAEGNIAMSTAIVVPMLMMGAAVAVDTGEAYRAKSNYQMAADAATLRAAKLVSTGRSHAEARAEAEAVFYENMGNIRQSSATITFDFDSNCTDKPVTSTVAANHPLHFSGIHGVGAAETDMNINVESEVKCANDSLEIAMVLDNSGSMGSRGKMTTLRAASQKLVTDIGEAMKDSPKQKALQFSLVPFSANVNVGRNMRNAAWMDRQGRSPIHHADLDWTHWPEGATQAADGSWRDGNGRALTRFTIFDTLRDHRNRQVEWAGCVQMRPYPHHTRDTAPTDANPETLFVPHFVADEPDRLRNKYYQYRKTGGYELHCELWGRQNRRRYCRRYSDYNGDGGYWPPGRSGRHYTGVFEHPYNGKYDNQGRYIGPGAVVTTSNRIEEINYSYNYIYDGNNMPDSLCEGLIQHEDCAGRNKGTWKGQHRRQRWAHKYYESRTYNSNRTPNSECTTAPITPLTTSLTTVKSRLAAMQPTGITNITMGVGWGWRTLSKGQPYTGGRDYGDAENRKIMIVLTDGQHYLNPVSNPNKSMPGGFGLGVHDGTDKDGFMFEGFDGKANPAFNNRTFQEAMDEHMIETCGNAKAKDITIYTIAFAVSDNKTKQMMQNCASYEGGAGSRKLYYDAGSNAELAAAFQSITESIQALRISK